MNAAMWQFTVASEAGSDRAPNEDLAGFSEDTVVVLDGLTSRTESGCRHGTPWYVQHLMAGILANLPLGATAALRAAISQTAEMHRFECDLSNPATPASAVAIVKFGPLEVRYLILSDITVVLGGPHETEVI